MDPMTAIAPTPSKPFRASGSAELLNFAYGALRVEAEILNPLNAELKLILGEDFDELKGHKDSRDGAGSYHMTILTPREYRGLRKSLKARAQELKLPEGPVAFEIVGIGTAESESSQTWFAVCRSEAVAAWRSALELPAHDLHITLAFEAEGDVHGVPKDVSTLIAVPDHTES